MTYFVNLLPDEKLEIRAYATDKTETLKSEGFWIVVKGGTFFGIPFELLLEKSKLKQPVYLDF